MTEKMPKPEPKKGPVKLFSFRDTFSKIKKVFKPEERKRRRIAERKERQKETARGSQATRGYARTLAGKRPRKPMNYSVTDSTPNRHSLSRYADRDRRPKKRRLVSGRMVTTPEFEAKRKYQ